MSDCPHHFHDWRGSAYDIGLQYGKTLKHQIAEACDPVLQSVAYASKQTTCDYLIRYLDAYESWFKQYTPYAIEEIQGIASGSGFDYDYLFFAATRDGASILHNQESGCTAFYCPAHTTRHGTPLIGQNKDANIPLARYQIMRRTYQGGHTTLTLNYPGWIANIGMNSHGLGWTGQSLYAKKSSQNTVPYSLLRTIISHSRCVGDVQKIIGQIPINTCCMMVADAEGGAICIESAHGQTIVQDISNHAFGHANCVVSNTLKPFAHDKPASPSSPYRQRNMQQKLNDASGGIDIDTMKTILSDHTDSPQSLCLHACDDEPLVTTASFIADLTKRQAHIAIGNPCMEPYFVYQL